MCGILGLYDPQHRSHDPQGVLRATRSLQHRGPDDEGFLFSDTRSGQVLNHPPPDFHAWNLAFGFRRLAILDLSPNGHQPMSSPDGQIWIVFNGEIYNYIELRQELAATDVQFRSGSDTEVILAAYQTWGEACLERLNGMWAFAIWDARQQKLFCARDRFGIKPFYYTWQDGCFAFASEIKALFELLSLPRRVNPAIVYDYLTFNLLDHSAETFFQGVLQLEPGQTLTLRRGDVAIRNYWELRPDPPHSPLPASAYAEQFHALFTDAVRLHLRSDVAIGSCLSGGLDSSAIVCVANRLLFGERALPAELVGQQQKTFSACFADRRFDERQHIEKVLQATNAEANYTFPDPIQLLQDLPNLLWHQEEPFGSLSIYAQWCVMRTAQQRGVRVTLDGQGADEMLAGYHGYFDYFWGGLLQRRALSELGAEWQAYRRRFGGSYPSLLARSLRPFLSAGLIRRARRYRRSGRLGAQVLGVHPDFAVQYQSRELENLPPDLPPFNGDLYANLRRLSLPKLLHYEDRNSMAFSIEARVPFLDHRLVEFAFNLPESQKIQRGVTKVVLRNAMEGTLPEEIRTRSDKMGFVTPEKVWLATELRPWAEEIFASTSFAGRPYFDVPAIRAAFRKHIAGEVDLTGLAWRWLNLELWLRRFVDEQAA